MNKNRSGRIGAPERGRKRKRDLLDANHDDVDDGKVVDGPGDVPRFVEISLGVPDGITHFNSPN